MRHNFSKIETVKTGFTHDEILQFINFIRYI